MWEYRWVFAQSLKRVWRLFLKKWALPWMLSPFCALCRPEMLVAVELGKSVSPVVLCYDALTIRVDSLASTFDLLRWKCSWCKVIVVCAVATAGVNYINGTLLPGQRSRLRGIVVKSKLLSRKAACAKTRLPEGSCFLVPPRPAWEMEMHDTMLKTAFVQHATNCPAVGIKLSVPLVYLLQTCENNTSGIYRKFAVEDQFY